MPDAAELLSRARVEVAPETFTLVGLRHDDWRRLLENPELSPRPESNFFLLRDPFEVTLLVPEEDWRAMRHAARDARVEAGFRLVTLSVFSRDHLLVKQEDLGRALRVLGEHVAELC